MSDSNPPIQPLEIQMQLTVAYTGFGGNTRGGKYFYSFDPDMVLVGKGQQGVKMRYTLQSEVPEYFRIVTLLSSDARHQIQDVVVSDDGRSVVFSNNNNIKTLIFFSIVVRDERRNLVFGCDPKVGNDPEIKPVLMASPVPQASETA
ncbi:hypothetical protein [Agrilutibacter solisilvae]|uniref:Uncharacterized protein n=1 Tax=Agrilutibacter solisilvae TaxID=2763317 RepID=A0A975ARI1_9GAMM|nr:hypothetical protein [Lysobacter solisilvae]QSX77899.1 hypothetical protein I8J32_014405 [Lysobacter solisilvae]